MKDDSGTIEGISYQHNSSKRDFNSWSALAKGTVIILLLIGIAITLLYSMPLLYQVMLIIVLASYFPLTYLSYLQFRAKAHQARVKDDFRLLGLIDTTNLDNTFQKLYSPQQFVIYVTLAVSVTLLGFGLFHLRIILIPDFPTIEKVAEIMFYSFLGAYIFSLYYVYRRYVTLDLQPTVYFYVTVRMVTVQIVAFIAAQLLLEIVRPDISSALVPIVAFVIGYFPDTGIRWLTSVAARLVEKLGQRDEKQLSTIEGISLWHETRLRESGVDNVQNLAAADVRELLLNSRFSAQQLMHWIDQAILMTNLPDDIYNDLHQHGISTISALRLFLDKFDEINTISLPDFAKTTEPDLRAVYYAAETGPNLHYVTYYWQAVQQYRTEIVTRSVKNLLQERFQTQTAEIATTLADVPAERLDLVINSLNITPQDLELLIQDSPQSLVGLGRVYIQREQYDEAIEVLDKVIAVDGENAEAYSTRGWARAFQNDYEQAFADYAIAKKLNPEDAVIFNREGSTFLRQKQNYLALESYDRAIELNPEYASAYYNRGFIYSRLGGFDKAIGDFDRALRYEPDRYQAYIERGYVYLDLDNYQEAISDFNTAIRHNRNDDRAYNGRAIAYLKSKEYQHAIYDLDTALDIDPTQGATYLNRGQVRRKMGDLEGAISDCTQALRVDNNLPQAYEVRARVYAQKGMLLEAITDFERYYDSAPPNAPKIEQYIKTLRQELLKRQTSTESSPSSAKTKTIST